MKKLLLVNILILLFFGCTSTHYVYQKRIVNILPKDAVNWSLDDCEKILNFYRADNSVINQNVYIRVMPLNKSSLSALARKEVIEKRLKADDFYLILDTYLKEYTSFKYDYSKKDIVEADPKFSKGYSFKIYFENISDPYERIFLEDGYSYFFLENMNGDFSRVTEVSGLFVEDYFELDGYLDAIVTFSPFAANGVRLFDSKNLNESYRLIFNGLQNNSIGIKWVLQ